MKDSNLPKAKRRVALGLAKRYLTGRQRVDALDWIREPARSGSDLSAFIDRIRAAHTTDQNTTEGTTR